MNTVIKNSHTNGNADDVKDRIAAPTDGKIGADYESNNLLHDKKLEAFKSNPIGLFGQWFQQAFDNGVPEPFVMSLATSSAKGAPSVRPVALCNVDAKGFYFSTNTESSKVKDLTENPRAAASFYWKKLDRVVRIEGDVIKVNDEALCYHKWPRMTQIAEHSKFTVGKPLDDRKELLKEMESLVAKFATLDVIPQPQTIQSFCIVPKRFEFVQLYVALPVDRISFTLSAAEGNWKCVRLAR